jgi:hypothetical protein
MKLHLFIAFGLLIASTPGAENTKRDPSGAESLTDRRRQPPEIERIAIYVTGPRWDVDRTSTVSSLQTNVAHRVLATRNEIAQLLTRLRPKEEKATRARIAARDGETYHLLLYDDRKGALTHVRVFDTGNAKDQNAEVYLRPDSAVSYVNDQIGPWLRSNISAAQTTSENP